MERIKLTEYFEEVETTEEYNGYFCSIAEAISIVVLGSLCGLKNVSQISSRKLKAKELLCHARMEWAVETMHWLLDVHYGEDYCRVENRTIQQNLNLLRKFSISLLKQYKTRASSKRAMSKIMLDCLLDPRYICAVLEN